MHKPHNSKKQFKDFTRSESQIRVMTLEEAAKVST